MIITSGRLPAWLPRLILLASALFDGGWSRSERFPRTSGAFSLSRIWWHFSLDLAVGENDERRSRPGARLTASHPHRPYPHEKCHQSFWIIYWRKSTAMWRERVFVQCVCIGFTIFIYVFVLFETDTIICGSKVNFFWPIWMGRSRASTFWLLALTLVLLFFIGVLAGSITLLNRVSLLWWNKRFLIKKKNGWKLSPVVFRLYSWIRKYDLI